jgi:hypothetical protein
MANASYTAFKNGVLGGLYDLDTAVVKAALVSGYVYAAGHTFMSDVTAAGGTVNGTPGTLANPTLVGGVFDADDVIIATTASASTHALIVYQSSAVGGGADVAPASQRLMFYFDTGTNLPITPGTGNVTITWPNTAGKIYKLG